MDYGFHVVLCVFVYVFLVFLARAFNVCFSRQGRTETCVYNRGRENVSDQFPSRPSPFFSPIPIDNHEPVQPAVKCGTSTRDGLIERLATFPILFRGRVFVLGFLSPVAQYACRFSRISTTRSSITHIFHTSFFPSCTHKCWRMIKRSNASI